MLVAIGSQNPVKIAATQAGFEAVWPDRAWVFASCDVPSGVSDQPMSNRESILGARNRARGALADSTADYGVGIESGLEQIDGVWFSTGWVVIVDANGTEGISSSMIRPVPLPSMTLVHQGVELGSANDSSRNRGRMDHGKTGGHEVRSRTRSSFWRTSQGQRV